MKKTSKNRIATEKKLRLDRRAIRRLDPGDLKDVCGATIAPADGPTGDGPNGPRCTGL